MCDEENITWNLFFFYFIRGLNYWMDKPDLLYISQAKSMLQAHVMHSLTMYARVWFFVLVHSHVNSLSTSTKAAINIQLHFNIIKQSNHLLSSWFINITLVLRSALLWIYSLSRQVLEKWFYGWECRRGFFACLGYFILLKLL